MWVDYILWDRCSCNKLIWPTSFRMTEDLIAFFVCQTQWPTIPYHGHDWFRCWCSGVETFYKVPFTLFHSDTTSMGSRECEENNRPLWNLVRKSCNQVRTGSPLKRVPSVINPNSSSGGACYDATPIRTSNANSLSVVTKFPHNLNWHRSLESSPSVHWWWRARLWNSRLQGPVHVGPPVSSGCSKVESSRAKSSNPSQVESCRRCQSDGSWTRKVASVRGVMIRHEEARTPNTASSSRTDYRLTSAEATKTTVAM
jgi:hypothetical protein